MRPPSHSPDNQSQAERLLDPIGRIWLACVGLLFILGSLSIKEVNTLIFLVGSLFALLSFNGARLSSITLGKDKVSAEMGLINRVAEFSKDKPNRIRITEDAKIPPDLLGELKKPFNAGIQTEGCGLAQLINTDQHTREIILQDMITSSGNTSLSERSIVGIGRVQDSHPSGTLFALFDDGSDFIVNYPSSTTEISSKASTDVGDGLAARPISLASAIQEDQNNE